ncbi:SusC/RagA family TonB-linked outer membrane protein [Hymenobacter wooponensis]|uniref:TonB-dependent receptor n=1 Tax=Hymenobacter wooponensis TaxID=1525360 RepID=A0A4Z0MQU7_9BACT|nr:TonB-dependent receptor [Hymenobacter wooponensis]TGD81606.1 TonB-dependent receptor [Hymenobacter wooponensis]
MRKTLLMFPVTVLAVASLDVQAQTRAVTGQVVGTDGAALPGVTVIVKGGAQGTSTDTEGRYSLSVPANATTLVYSFIGYASKEVVIGTQSSINVTLASGATGLDEVVVVGYGTQSRRDLTGSVATVTAAQIANKPVQSFEQALQGQASGVNITTPNGVLNAPPVVRIRGVNSISLSSAPLYVIDGIPAFSGNSSAVGSVPNNPLSNINPNDIESVEVLKDASATAIYGSRAAGGVILVTTKRGKKGQSKISVDSWAGWTEPVRLYDVLNTAQYMEIKNEAVRNLNANLVAQGLAPSAIEGFRPTQDANGNTVDTRWYDYIYRTGFSTSNNINFSGGSEKTSYYTSVGYTDQKGMLEGNTFKRASGRINIDHKVFSRFTVGLRAGYTNSRTASPNSGSVGDGAFGTAGLGRLPLVLPPNVPARNIDGSYNISGAGIGPGANINPTSATAANPNGSPLLPGYYNPLVDLENNYFRSDGNEVQGSIYANLELIKGLNLRTTYGVYNIAFEDKAFYTPIAGDQYNVGSASNFYRTNKRWNWQNTLQYDVTLAGKHNLSFLAGNENQNTNIDRWGLNRSSVADPFFTTLQGGYVNVASSGNFQGENFLTSYFGRINYNFSSKYLATINVRRDGYSAWAKKWGNFYGASLGYAISEEDFWKNSSALSKVSFLKFTGSYGEVGNAQGIDDYASLRLYEAGLYGPSPTFYLSSVGNPELTWETSKKTDVGVSFGLLDDRITGDVAYYRNLLDGLILQVPQAASRGIPGGQIPDNVGSMRNTGVEINLRVDAIRKTDFTWSINANLTTLKNRVLALASEGQRIGTATSGLETVNYTKAGQSVGEILAVRSLGVNPENGRRLIQLRNEDGTFTTVQYNHSSTSTGNGWTTLDGRNSRAPNQLVDGEYFGPVIPTWYGGFDNSFRYKGFDLGVFVQFSGGNYIYNGTKAGLHDQRFWNNDVDILDRWTETNRGGEWPRVVYGDNTSNGSALIMSNNVEKGDFARLRNVSLGYSLQPTLISRLGMSSARFYVQVQNAALLTKYSGIDPEISTNGASNTGAGVDRNSVGQARTYTVGFNIGF